MTATQSNATPPPTGPSPAPFGTRLDRFALPALILLGLGLRLLFLDGKSFWLDEANALRVAGLGQDVLWAGRGEGYHPPLFYMLLAAWQTLGDDEWTLRLIGVIPSVLTLPLLYWLGHSIAGRAVALTTVALAAGSPLLVWYAQETRSYALLGLFCALFALAVVQTRTRLRPLWWLILVLALTAGLYLHYFAALFVPLGLLLLVLSAARGERVWAGVGSLVAASAAALLAYWPWLQSPAARRFLAIATADDNYIAQLVRTRLDFLPWADQIYWLLPVAGLVGFALGLLVAYLTVRKLLPTPRVRRALAWRGLPWLLLLAYALLLVLTVWPRAYSLKRQLVMLWPFLLLIFAWFWPWQRALRPLLTGVLALTVVAALVNVIVIPKPDWRALQAHIASHAAPGDLVLLEPPYMTIPFDYYDQGNHTHRGLAFGTDAAAWQEIQAGHPRIWHVVHRSDADPAHRNVTWLDGHLQRLSATEFYRLELRLYQARP